MENWSFALRDPSEQLAQLHYFSMKRRQPEGDIEFLITVREYVQPPDPTMQFFAQADKQTNQRTAPFTPTGWGETLLDALSACMEAIRRFPYEAQEPVRASPRR